MDIKLIINNKETTFDSGISLLENLSNIGIEIPSLCYHKDLGSQDVCGICVVEIDGELVKSCSTNPKEGMVVRTYTDEIEARRKEILEKLMKNHPNDCLICEKAKGDCQLQDACYEYGVENRNEKPIKVYEIDRSSEGMI
uniref:2Fe-2S iron-sulfur cluster-binding protein n=1 Tax=Ilyobacter sp. TaxID=3100343 RepID=UPI00356449E6